MFTVKVKVEKSGHVVAQFPRVERHFSTVCGGISAHTVNAIHHVEKSDNPFCDFVDLLDWAKHLVTDHLEVISGGVYVVRRIVPDHVLYKKVAKSGAVAFDLVVFRGYDVGSIEREYNQRQLDIIEGSDHGA